MSFRLFILPPSSVRRSTICSLCDSYDATQGFKLRDSVIKNTSVLKSVIDFRLAEANGTSVRLRFATTLSLGSLQGS